MFTFTNTHVINTNIDTASQLVKFTGDATKSTFKVKRAGSFVKSNVTSVTKRAGYNGVKSTATFAAPEAPTVAGQEDIYRISLFMKQTGKEDITMASANTPYKSKPFHIEFKAEVGDTEENIVDAMVKAVKFYQANMYPYIKAEKVATVDDNGTDGDTGDDVTTYSLKISGVDEYETFLKAELEKLVSAPTTSYPDDQNKFVKVSSATIVNGKCGFGTYTQIMKDLRLPTLENTRWISPNAEELPVMGALYNQYTITYCVDRGVIGSDAVGDTTKSTTQHVFFVKNDLATAFESAITTAKLSITTINK